MVTSLLLGLSEHDWVPVWNCLRCSIWLEQVSLTWLTLSLFVFIFVHYNLFIHYLLLLLLLLLLLFNLTFLVDNDVLYPLREVTVKLYLFNYNTYTVFLQRITRVPHCPFWENNRMNWVACRDYLKYFRRLTRLISVLISRRGSRKLDSSCCFDLR